ncbi:hypothetical protein DFS34DRAFT_650766 [Phlyctochytrium arcticum]|nr:hypothetical protein DFS34DRAFT_650766 [Phlyctochytrium arcticum]
MPFDWSPLLRRQQPGTPVGLDIDWTAGLIVVSYVTSVAGAWVALELIRLRTSNRGWFNWMLLVLASFVTGGLAIFSMHFIGMTAFELHQAGGSVRVYFTTALTIGSLLEPIFCVCVAVYISGAQENPSILRLFLGGAFAALGICLMHFTAMEAMRVRINFIPALVALSCVIAFAATTTALAVFFRLRALWQNSAWKQMGCAMILSGAICCMHYVGMAAARYSIDPRYPPNGDAVSDGTLSVSDVLRIGLGFSGVCGVMTLGLLGMRLRNYYYGIGVQKGQMTLAVLLVDSRGFIMVDSQGKLPSRAVLGNFDISATRPSAHPALLWLLKTSNAWSRVNDLGMAFRRHGGRVQKLLTDLLVDRRGEDAEHRLMPFFRLALMNEVVSLSSFLGIPFEKMGVLYDTILEARDGWVGLIVDRLDGPRAGELAAKGFRWTPPKHVVGILSRHLRVSPSSVRPIIADIPDYLASRSRPVKSGLHVGMLLVHPKVGQFQVMVPSRDRSTIPEVELSPIAFGALMDNANNLSNYLAPILTGGGGDTMELADYVAASEILSALTRMGVGMDASAAVPLDTLNVPDSVLVLQRNTKSDMGQHHQSKHILPPITESERKQYPWASRVPFKSWVPSTNPAGDVDMLLFVRLHSAVGGKFVPPAGFTLIDLAVFEAMHYARCFPARFQRVLGMEMADDLQEMIVPTPLVAVGDASGPTPIFEDKKDSRRGGLQKITASHLWRTSVEANNNTENKPKVATGMDEDSSDDEHGHTVLNVDEILREGPPSQQRVYPPLANVSTPPTVARLGANEQVHRMGSKSPLLPADIEQGSVAQPQSSSPEAPLNARASVSRRLSLSKIRRALGLLADRTSKDGSSSYPNASSLSVNVIPSATKQSNLKNNNNNNTDSNNRSQEYYQGGFPLSDLRNHSLSLTSDDDEAIPQILGPDASPAANAWQAMRWIKLYINAELRSTAAHHGFGSPHHHNHQNGTPSNHNYGSGGHIGSGTGGAKSNNGAFGALRFATSNWTKTSLTGHHEQDVGRKSNH